jgi:hypothetical protein
MSKYLSANSCMDKFNKFNTILIQRSVKQKNINITQSGYLLYEHSKHIIKLLDDTVYRYAKKLYIKYG